MSADHGGSEGPTGGLNRFREPAEGDAFAGRDHGTRGVLGKSIVQIQSPGSHRPVEGLRGGDDTRRDLLPVVPSGKLVRGVHEHRLDHLASCRRIGVRGRKRRLCNAIEESRATGHQRGREACAGNRVIGHRVGVELNRHDLIGACREKIDPRPRGHTTSVEDCRCAVIPSRLKRAPRREGGDRGVVRRAIQCTHRDRVVSGGRSHNGSGARAAVPRGGGHRGVGMGPCHGIEEAADDSDPGCIRRVPDARRDDIPVRGRIVVCAQRVRGDVKGAVGIDGRGKRTRSDPRQGRNTRVDVVSGRLVSTQQGGAPCGVDTRIRHHIGRGVLGVHVGELERGKKVGADKLGIHHPRGCILTVDSVVVEA